MANIVLSESPAFSIKMGAMEKTTPAHCDEWNRRHKQLLENDLYLYNKVVNIEQQTNNITGNTTKDAFSEEKTYKKGDYCIYDNVLYEFTDKKTPGEWEPSVVASTTVIEQLYTLNSKIEALYKRLGGLSFQMKTQAEFDETSPQDKHTVTFIDPTEEE